MKATDAAVLMDSWSRRARRSEAAHYFVASAYSRRQEALTALVVLLAAVTGSGLLATYGKTISALHLALGVVGLVAAGTAGLERSLRYAERAERHRAVGAKWAQVVNQAETIIVGLPDTSPPESVIDQLRSSMDQLTTESPYIPQRIFNRFRIAETYLVVNAASLPRRS